MKYAISHLKDDEKTPFGQFSIPVDQEIRENNPFLVFFCNFLYDILLPLTDTVKMLWHYEEKSCIVKNMWHHEECL